MKKKATVLIASIMAFCGINTAHADEGMWTIYNLPNAVYEMMQSITIIPYLIFYINSPAGSS